jgi:hypothetical protein
MVDLMAKIVAANGGKSSGKLQDFVNNRRCWRGAADHETAVDGFGL